MTWYSPYNRAYSYTDDDRRGHRDCLTQYRSHRLDAHVKLRGDLRYRQPS